MNRTRLNQIAHHGASAARQRDNAENGSDAKQSTTQGDLSALALSESGSRLRTLDPGFVLHLQRTMGNTAVRRLIQRDGPQNRSVAPAFTPARNYTLGSDAQQNAQAQSQPNPDAAYRRARSLIDATPTNQLNTLRQQIEAAIEAHPASGLFTLQLGGQSISGFPSDRLNDLLGTTDVGSRRNFERAQRAEEVRLANERLNQFLRDAENPQRGVMQTANYFYVHDRSGQLQQLTQEQLTAWRGRLNAELSRLINQARTNLAVAQDVRQHFAGTANGRWNPQSEQESNDLAFGAADATLAQTQLAQGQYYAAYQTILSALSTSQRAHQAVVGGLQDTAGAERNLAILRFVRDASAAIFGTLVTVAVGGSSGAILLGAAVGAAGAAGGQVEDQYYETGQVNWNAVLWDSVFNTVSGFVGGTAGGALTRALVREMSVELIRMGVPRAARLIVLQRIVPVVTNGVVARIAAAGGANASGTMQNQTVGYFTPADPRRAATSQYQRLTDEQIDQATSDQTNFRNNFIEVWNQSSGLLGEALRAAARGR